MLRRAAVAFGLLWTIAWGGCGGDPADSNTPPTVVDDVATLRAGETLRIEVLANDSDPDGDALSVTAVGDADGGVTAVLGAVAVSYAADPALTGEDAFTYTVTDARGATAEGRVTVEVLPALEENGEPCDSDDACASGHCRAGLCCAEGDCCLTAEDCPEGYAEAPSCDDAATCQGTRRDVVCGDFVCATGDPVDDDTACGADTLALDCTPMAPAYCTGEDVQIAPECGGGCSADADCAEGYHCDGTCQPDRPDGSSCDEPSDCRSAHCGNGYCCAEGDCCSEPVVCPAEYAVAAACEDPEGCQGTRRDAVCVDHVCGTGAPVQDDSACDGATQALACGAFAPAYCDGGVDQAPPTCATTCLADAACAEGHHCDGGTCVIDLADGALCDEASDCASNYCGNGVCCAGGDCCTTPADCPSSYASDPVCAQPATCQGTRREAQCQDHSCVSGPELPDDSGCSGLLASTCGLYPSVWCNGQSDQAPPSCATGCTIDAGCDPGAHCDAGVCVADLGPGRACDEPSDCAQGLFCADGVCCTSSCTGPCRRCDHTGFCNDLPYGQDPDEECGVQSCDGYYYGWTGSSCYARAPVPATLSACDGAGACLDAAQLCPSMGPGAVVLSCDLVCQEPQPGTCTGTTAGLCDDVQAGTVTCGLGVCERTQLRCVGGEESVCTPFPPSIEVCNDRDDDCNGTVDDHVAGATDALESNSSCSTRFDLGTIAEAGAIKTWSATVYPAGDADFYRVTLAEGSHTCFPGTSQSYTLLVRMTPPGGDDCVDYDVVVYDDSCTALRSSSLGSCQQEEIRFTWSGTCGADDSRSFRIGVHGSGSGAWECVPYSLQVDMY